MTGPSRAAARSLKLRVISNLAPPRASRNDAAENGTVAVHHLDAPLAETRDEDAAVILAAAKLANETIGRVLVDVALSEDGEAGAAETRGAVEDCGGPAASEGDAGVAAGEARGCGGDCVATDVIDGVGGDAHLA
ncbi:hypothetical protein V493_00241 [Pseudogymnoascus sp. VKM F-4281 (FW-2241)]|nr:hypothetical protein V493_00241 [Pseudogymnoascus sp. VKM F-4281 (FW-2241)]